MVRPLHLAVPMFLDEAATQVLLLPLKSVTFLAGAGSAFVTNNGGTTVCKTDSSGKILYMGDWCSTTNMAGGCADSVQMTANFAASSVIID